MIIVLIQNIGFKWFPESQNTTGYNDGNGNEQHDSLNNPRTMKMKEMSLLESTLSYHNVARRFIIWNFGYIYLSLYVRKDAIVIFLYLLVVILINQF